MAQPAADAIIFSIWKGKACGFGVSFGKLERLTGYAILWGAAQNAPYGFHYDNGIHFRLSSCLFPTVRESRIYGGHPSGGRINESRTIGN